TLFRRWAYTALDGRRGPSVPGSGGVRIESRLPREDSMPYDNILVDIRGRVALVTLNRPKALNALNDALMNELGEALAKFDADEGIGAIVIAGGDKAFAAGADIGAMKDRGYRDVYMGEFVTRNWERMKSVRKPVIAAVAG